MLAFKTKFFGDNQPLIRDISVILSRTNTPGRVQSNVRPHLSGDEGLDHSTVLAPPVLCSGQVAACGADGVIYHLNADSGDCEETRRFAAPITAAPVPLEDGIAVVTRDGVLRRFGR